jgi:hypothetical protein
VQSTINVMVNCTLAAAAVYRATRVDSPGLRMFVFFSNRLGCGGSLLLSAIVTVVVLILTGVLG